MKETEILLLLHPSSGNPRCPVASFLKYLSKLNPMNLYLWQRPKASFKHHARVIYQTNRDASAKKNMKKIPTSVVNEILAFSVEAPAWIEQLNLWKEVSRWLEGLCVHHTFDAVPGFGG